MAAPLCTARSAATNQQQKKKNTAAINHIRRFVEKPAEWSGGNLANAGVYLCEPAILDVIPAGFSDFGHDIIPALLEANAIVCGHLATGYLLDIGTPDTYAQAQRDWQGR